MDYVRIFGMAVCSVVVLVGVNMGTSLLTATQGKAHIEFV